MKCWNSQQRSGWIYSTVVLCTFGFFVMMRPAEPFLTLFLMGSYKNLTMEQVSRQVYPVWTYTNLSFLIPVFLLTDIFRYKPVVFLQGLAYMMAWLLLLFGTGLRSIQSALFSYGLALALEVGYMSYIYSVVHKEHYQKVTSYSRGAILLGYAVGCLLGQILVHFGISLFCLNVITLSSISITPFISLLLPMPQKTILLNSQHSRSPNIEISTDSSRVPSQCSFSTLMRANRRRIMSAVMKLIVDCKECYSSVTLIFLSLWWAMGKCGFCQISSYVQILWSSKFPQNFTAYNGGVDAFSTLSGAAASFAVSHMTLNWSLWGELVLGLFSAIAAGAVALMNLTSNIWICYACYMMFKSLYMFLATICTFQIAKNLKTECYALIFGINSFVAVTLQTILTATVINSKNLALPLTAQYYIYATYFATIAVIFLIRGAYILLHLRHNLSDNGIASDTHEERTLRLPENSQMKLSQQSENNFLDYMVELSERVGKSARQQLAIDDVSQWSASFDALLSHKHGLAAFREFLRTEFSDENIEFWMACEDYKKITPPAKLVTQASKIYEEFINVQAPREVNIDFHTREVTKRNLREPSPSSFSEAQARVYSLMEKDSYPRFIRSQMYMDLLNEKHSDTVTDCQRVSVSE